MDISGELKFDLVSALGDAEQRRVMYWMQDHEVYRQRLDPATGVATGEEERHDIVDGKFVGHKEVHGANSTCGSCYGAEDAFFQDDKKDIHCCNSCRQALEIIPRLYSPMDCRRRCTRLTQPGDGICYQTRWCISAAKSVMLRTSMPSLLERDAACVEP